MRFLTKIISVVTLSIVFMALIGNQVSAQAVGKDYMLIVAVGEFEKDNGGLYVNMDLSKDVNRIKESFKKHKLRLNHQIIELINEKATKESILNAMDKISRKLTKNDRFYFYFSGHGTSPADLALYNKYIKHLPSKNRQFLNNTSAILPYDFDVNDINNTLIIGNRDFKPRIKAIDKKVGKAMVILDACFSSHMVRGPKFSADFTGKQGSNLKKTTVIASTGPSSNRSDGSQMTKVVANCASSSNTGNCVKKTKTSDPISVK
jgi:hypothetical protein